jgi:tocopherol cyclase
MRGRLLDAYRRTGAELPFGDPGRAHGTPMEGYYWRIVDASAGRVIVLLCGVCQAPEGRWAVVALAAHPGGLVRHAVLSPASADADGFGVRAAELVRGSADRLSARIADDAWVVLRLRSAVRWPRRAFGALGPAQLLPSLAQYWQPVVLAAEVRGEACLDGERVRLDGASAYVEKNWGPRFAGDWWWGHAGAFPRRDVSVAFAGGRVDLLGQVVAPTALVLRLGPRVLRFAPPLARTRTRADGHAWQLRARSARYAVELEGEPAGQQPHVLPVPDVASGQVHMRSRQYLAGWLRLRLSRGPGGATVFEGESALAGLERGMPASFLSAPGRGAPRR